MDETATPYPLKEKKWPLQLENWERTSVDLARFYFEQAEKELAFTERAFDSLTSRASTLVGILIPSIAALIIYLLGIEKNKFGFQNEVVVAIVAMTIPVGYSLIRLCSIFLPSKFRNIGSSPRNLIQQKFIKEEFDTNDLQIINILYSECEAYQDRIDSNDKLNKKLGRRFRWAMYSLATCPLFAVLGYLLALLFIA